MKVIASLQALYLFLIGLVTVRLLNEIIGQPNQNQRNSNVSLSAKHTQINEITVNDVKKMKILCFVDTAPKYHSKRVVHVLQTWGKHCDQVLFASTLTDINLGSIGFNVTDDHRHMWGKVKLMLQYIHKYFIDDYDWFFKADDDTFLIAENMRYLLSAYSPDDPLYFGYKMNTSDHIWGYFSGGSGYVLSRKTVRIFVEQIMTQPRFYHEQNWKGCHLETDERIEDWEITMCLDYYNIYPGDGRDAAKRDRFHLFRPERHLLSILLPWYWQRKYYKNDEGLECCSNYSVSFHYIDPPHQYFLYYLTYLLKPYGIVRKFPPPPKKAIFSDIAHKLDQERTDKTLRGA